MVCCSRIPILASFWEVCIHTKTHNVLRSNSTNEAKLNMMDSNLQPRFYVDNLRYLLMASNHAITFQVTLLFLKHCDFYLTYSLFCKTSNCLRSNLPNIGLWQKCLKGYYITRGRISISSFVLHRLIQNHFLLWSFFKVSKLVSLPVRCLSECFTTD